MEKFFKSTILTLLFTFLLSISVVLATLSIHEIGHYITGIMSGCKNIKLVIFSSDYGTYTEMTCPTQQSLLFPTILFPTILYSYFIVSNKIVQFLDGLKTEPKIYYIVE